MSERSKANDSRFESAGLVLPGWLLMALRELKDLWLTGKAFLFLILFSIILGVMSFLLATDVELRLIPPKEMMFLTLQVTIAFGLFVSLIISADSISGERERATLEGLLLAPTSRRQIVLGKFLASLSPWPIALAISFPYFILLSPGEMILGQTVVWGSIVGSLLVVAFTGLGMLISIWSTSNKTSLSLSLILYLIFLFPTQLPGSAQTGAVGILLRKVNPIGATNFFLQQVLVAGRTSDIMGSWLLAPVVFATLILVILFLLASPGLALHGGKLNLIPIRRQQASGLLMLCLIAGLGYLPARASQVPAFRNSEGPLEISLSLDYKVVKTGDRFEFSTTVTFNDAGVSPPMLVAMNVVNLGRGDPVDPEDWSPERNQFIKPLLPGESIDQDWTIHAILEGNYMVYMAVIPDPGGPEATSQPVASSGLHLTVTPYVRLNPGGVLPLAIGMPVGLAVLMTFLRWQRRRGIDNGETAG